MHKTEALNDVPLRAVMVLTLLSGGGVKECLVTSESIQWLVTEVGDGQAGKVSFILYIYMRARHMTFYRFYYLAGMIS